MKISTLTLSNIQSFAPAESLTGGAQTLDFSERPDNQEQLTILIGPNGSGKSTVLQIIRLVFNGLLLQSCQYTPERKSVIQKKQQVFVGESGLPRLPKHRHFEDQPQRLEIGLVLTSLDEYNLHLLRKKRKQLQKVHTSFATNIDIHPSLREQPINICGEQYMFSLENTSGQFICQHRTACPRLVYEYIRRYHFFQAACDFLILFEQENNRSDFQRSFALLGSERTYTVADQTFDVYSGLPFGFGTDGSDISLAHIRHQLLTLLHEELPIFGQVKKRLIQTYRSHMRTLSPGQAYLKTLQSSRLRNINTHLTELFACTFTFSVPQDEFGTYEFFFVPSEGNYRIRFSEMGSGEKSIIHFLFEIYAQELNDGLLIIEEPELHVHPHLQEMYLHLLQSISRSQGTQCVISTHSPFFVNHSTIGDLVRLQKVEHNGVHSTHLFKPHRITLKEKNLIKSLDYNIAGNIFFVDKAIIVEGPDDHYFFEHLIKDRKHDHPEQETVRNYDLFQLNGKQLFRQFQTFLRKFGLETFYIGDRDNIGNILHIDYFPYRFELKQATGRDETVLIKHHYADLVEYMQQQYAELYQNIVQRIDSLYEDNIFILKQGSIENYVSTKRKGFEYMIQFCKNGFSSWKKDQNYATKRKELESILSRIFSS